MVTLIEKAMSDLSFAIHALVSKSVELAKLEERMACAKIVEDFAANRSGGVCQSLCDELAKVIRKRGTNADAGERPVDNPPEPSG